MVVGTAVVVVVLSAAVGKVDGVALGFVAVAAIGVAHLWIRAGISRDQTPVSGARVDHAAESDQPRRTVGPHASASIRIVRPAGDYASRMRQFVIVIDGEAVGGLSEGEAQTFAVSAGTHTVRAKIDWCRSRRLTLDLSEHDQAQLVCGNPPLATMLAIFWFTLGCRRYPQLALRVASAKPH